MRIILRKDLKSQKGIPYRNEYRRQLRRRASFRSASACRRTMAFMAISRKRSTPISRPVQPPGRLRPHNAKRTQTGCAAVQSKGDLDLADISHRAASPQDLIAELDAARRRRDESLELWVLRSISASSMVRNHLELARDLVAEFKQDVDRLKRARR